VRPPVGVRLIGFVDAEVVDAEVVDFVGLRNLCVVGRVGDVVEFHIGVKVTGTVHRIVVVGRELVVVDFLVGLHRGIKRRAQLPNHLSGRAGDLGKLLGPEEDQAKDQDNDEFWEVAKHEVSLIDSTYARSGCHVGHTKNMHNPVRSVPPAEVTDRSLVTDLLKTARPKQWVKNGFVFAALIFASKLGHADLVARTVAAFVLFCVLSSAVYFLNDSLDVEADRQHPLKSSRPIAAGRIPVSAALAVATGLAIVSVGLAFVLDVHFGLVALGYLALQVAYSIQLKHLVLIDVFVIAAGFVLRAAGGAVVIHVTISPWLYLCTILVSLFLGFGKRRHELVLLEDTARVHRRNLEEYTGPLLDDLINIVAGATVIAYSLYTFYASDVPHNHAMMLTIPFVLYGIFRYLLLVHRTDMGGSPEEAVWRDLPLTIDVILWAIIAAFILHFSR
jgi:4-hydroxybenzoate polyprenyltransferase